MISDIWATQMRIRNIVVTNKQLRRFSAADFKK
jgi:hypothetical protein